MRGTCSRWRPRKRLRKTYFPEIHVSFNCDELDLLGGDRALCAGSPLASNTHVHSRRPGQRLESAETSCLSHQLPHRCPLCIPGELGARNHSQGLNPDPGGPYSPSCVATGLLGLVFLKRGNCAQAPPQVPAFCPVGWGTREPFTVGLWSQLRQVHGFGVSSDRSTALESALDRSTASESAPTGPYCPVRNENTKHTFFPQPRHKSFSYFKIPGFLSSSCRFR